MIRVEPSGPPATAEQPGLAAQGARQGSIEVTPRFSDLLSGRDFAGAGREMHAWMAEAYPLCRSITGPGLRLTLKSLASLIPLETTEVPTGARVFDWTVPREWEVREAWIKDSAGKKIVDFRDHNLHVLNYSVPVRARLPLSQLKARLHSLPDRPSLIPYRTSYYQENWGFCLPHRLLQSLPEGEYEVCIDSSLREGSLTYGECVVPGRSTEEVWVSAHCCHPSLANDNLSGMAVAAFWARALLAESRAGRAPRYTYRFVFAPATLGALAFLSRNRETAPRVRHGLILALLGDASPFTYKKSRRGAPVDRALAHVLARRGRHTLEEFSPVGYDERQYCSPGFDLPMGCLMRSPPGTFPEYHTSADNLDFVKPERLGDSLAVCLSACDIFENDGVFINRNPCGEPQLGRRGLFQGGNGGAAAPEVAALQWVLNMADGRRGLLETAERSGLPFQSVRRAAAALLAHGLLEEAPGENNQ